MRQTRRGPLVSCAILGAGTLLSLTLPAKANVTHAAGGGTYILSGILTEFQFSRAHVQCKIGHGILADGTVIQMVHGK